MRLTAKQIAGYYILNQNLAPSTFYALDWLKLVVSTSVMQLFIMGTISNCHSATLTADTNKNISINYLSENK